MFVKTCNVWNCYFERYYQNMEWILTVIIIDIGKNVVEKKTMSLEDQA